MKNINEYPFWHLAAAECLSSVHYVTAEQAKLNGVENKNSYVNDRAEPWVAGKAFVQYQREYGAPWREGWWWYVELNDEDAPLGGPYKTLEQAARAGMRKYGRGGQARFEVTYNLLFATQCFLHNVVNLGTDCYARGVNVKVSARTVKALRAKWLKLAAAGNWHALEKQWGFKPDKTVGKQVAAVMAGTALLNKLRAERAVREEKLTNEQLKAALKEKGFKYRKHGDNWQWWWAESQWRNYVPGITEREILLLEGRAEKVYGLEDDLQLKQKVCEQTGAHYGNLE